MNADREPRSSNAGTLLLVLFAGFEVVQAISQHDATLLFGTWLALTAALVLAMRMPATRVSFTSRERLGTGVRVAVASWAALAVVAAVVALVAGRPFTWVWAGAAVVAALLTPVAVSAGVDSAG